ncbi:hypothetical protein [Flavobacterium sp.]|uniref:hypothetical protein n=1 Tax=Flavobacterium sp. TaxID=239 RepID=UPI0026067C49|nr:hypothetical protein [Flavobacterium sp.]
MKIIVILILIFTYTSIYSQDYKALKKADTIYVLFKGKKFERKGVSPDNVERSYHFYGFEKEFFFSHYKYQSYERKIANIVSDVKIVDESFIKKNDSKIITRRFLKRNDLCKVVAEILNHNRTIYIIDCTEKKEGKIVLYEVLMSTICRGDG